MAITDAVDGFKPALLVIDLQEDFCPPRGSLAVPYGRDITPIVNKLLGSPAFHIRVATRDWHPADHISFATNHQTGDTDERGQTITKKPFEDFVKITNPNNLEETIESRLWPVHCVQNTPGAELIPELDTDKLDRIVDKGQDARVEMYSPFFDPFRSGNTRGTVCDSGLADLLLGQGITDVYVVGLAADYCVQSAAVDAAKIGIRTYVVEEATRAVDDEAWQREGKKALESEGVKLVRMDGQEVAKLRLS